MCTVFTSCLVCLLAVPTTPPQNTASLELAAPEDVLDEDATFVATVREGLGGTARFALKTYAGDTVWTRDTEIEDGRATVVLLGSDAAALDKGSRVLVATVNGEEGQSAYAAVRLRGRIFQDVAEAPPGLRPGDEIVITDLSGLQPPGAIADRSVKGKWWRRAYTTPDGDTEHHLVCVEEQDLDDPASCLAPPLTLPLHLGGWYEVWVRTYRHRHGGGIDVRLSDEKYFVHANPLQVNTSDRGPKPDYGVFVDILYRAADLTGQSLVFQQPYGTYDSEHKLCNASLAGVRLIKLSDQQVARIQAGRARPDTKIISFDNDGFSYFWKWGVHDPACIARLLEPLRDQSAAFFNIELAGLGGITIPTPYTGMYQMTGHTRDGDYRANAFFRWCFENDVNIVDVLTERAHEVGLKLFVSLMMERSFSPDATMKAHPEWMIRRGPGRWDYALPEVQDYQVKKISWIMEHHAIDGFIVDFTRYGHFFNEDEPNKFAHMNTFLRKLRAATDTLNANKDRKVLLCGSFGDRSWHLTHWGTGKLDDQGLDVQTWLDEGIFDLLMPEGATALDFVAMAKDSRTQVWPREVSGVSIETHQRVGGAQGPKDLERGVKWALDNGAPGIFFFNHETWSTLARLGFREELELRTKTDAVYGLHQGPKPAFTRWYPDLDQRQAQRTAFKPVTIATDAAQKVDGDLTVPVRNTFPEAVTATVRWARSSDEAAGPWGITPAEGSVSIAAGEEGEVVFHLTGHAPRQAVVPAARIEMASGDQVVFRHRLPVRAVPRVVCRKVSAPPAMDAVEPCPFFRVDTEGQRAGQTSMALAYDDENLYVTFVYSGIDVSAIPKEPHKRDARAIFTSDRLEILIDANGAEQEYLEFIVTPAGGQADSRSYYYPFAGHFQRKRDWNAEWAAQTAWRDDGYAIQAVIPFQALGAAPAPGAVWRMNLAAYDYAGGDKAQVSSWSSPEKAFHDVRCFGTVEFN